MNIKCNYNYSHLKQHSFDKIDICVFCLHATPHHPTSEDVYKMKRGSCSQVSTRELECGVGRNRIIRSSTSIGESV